MVGILQKNIMNLLERRVIPPLSSLVLFQCSKGEVRLQKILGLGHITHNQTSDEVLLTILADILITMGVEDNGFSPVFTEKKLAVSTAARLNGDERLVCQNGFVLGFFALFRSNHPWVITEEGEQLGIERQLESETGEDVTVGRLVIASIPAHRPIVGIPEKFECHLDDISAGIRQITDTHIGITRQPCPGRSKRSVHLAEGSVNRFRSGRRYQWDFIAHPEPTRHISTAFITVVRNPISRTDDKILCFTKCLDFGAAAKRDFFRTYPAAAFGAAALL